MKYVRIRDCAISMIHTELHASIKRDPISTNNFVEDTSFQYGRALIVSISDIFQDKNICVKLTKQSDTVFCFRLAASTG